MIRACLLLGMALAMPGAASAYTVTLKAGPLDTASSRFEPLDFPASRFEERPQASSAGPSGQTSSFALKGMDSGTRIRTEATLSELGARQEKGRIIVSLPSDVLFDFDKSGIREDARPVLTRLSEVLIAMPGAPVAITGHTDSKGSDDYNQALSERRAASVRDWLGRLGVADARLSTDGRGESLPVAPNQNPDGSDNPEGRQKNRRVEFVIGAGE